MAIFYLDTSAVLKRYRTEKGTDVVTELYEDHGSTRDLLLSSHFTCLEVESVAARALKGRLLNQQAYDALLGAFSQDLGEYLVLLSLSGDVVNDAVQVARLYSVRAPDAIHVASAERGNRQVTGGKFVFVASDKELLSATHAAGMNTLDPEADDAMEQLRKLRAAEKT